MTLRQNSHTLHSDMKLGYQCICTLNGTSTRHAIRAKANNSLNCNITVQMCVIVQTECNLSHSLSLPLWQLFPAHVHEGGVSPPPLGNEGSQTMVSVLGSECHSVSHPPTGEEGEHGSNIAGLLLQNTNEAITLQHSSWEQAPLIHILVTYSIHT